MITRRLFTLALAGALPLAGMFGGQANAQDLREITFVQPSPSAINSYPVFVAIGEGYFEEEGLDVSVEAINGSAAVLQALSAGTAHFGRPGPGPVLGARSRDVDAVFIYNVAARSNFGIVVREDSEFQSPEDLRGKVIGTGTADGSEVGFARNVMAGSDMVAGTDFEFLTVGDGGPATVAFNSGEMARFFGNGLATMGDTIRNDRELVEKFGRAFARAHAFALDDANRKAVLAHLKAGNPQEGEDPEFQSALFDAVRSKTIPVDMSNGLGYQPPEVWAEWQDSLIAGGDLKEPLEDLSAAFTNEFIAMWNEAIAQ